MEKTNEMEIINQYMTQLDDERWGENSANELSYLLSHAVTFTDLNDVNAGKSELKFVDAGDKKIAVVVYTLDTDTAH